MAHPTLDRKHFIGQTGLFCINDFTGTYYYTHELLGVYYMNTLIKANNDILNTNLDRLFIIINWKKNISVSLNDLFLPYKSENEKKKVKNV